MANEHYYQLSDLRLRVRDQLDESSASFWTDAQLDRYINRAKNRTWNRLKALNAYYCTVTRTSLDGALTIMGESYTCTSFQIIAGTSDYTLPPDVATLSAIECITSGYETLAFTFRDLNHPDFRSARAYTTNQAPADEVYFAVINEPPVMRIAPKLSVALDLRLTYVQRLADLSANSDRLLLPGPLDGAVVDFATFYALRQDRSPDATVYRDSAEQIINEEFGADARQTQDPQVVRGYLDD